MSDLPLATADKPSSDNDVTNVDSSVFYVLVNQNNQLLARSGEWLGTKQEKLLYRSKFKDEAINLKVDHAVKQPDMRLRLIEVTMNEGKLVFEPDHDLVEFVAPPVIDAQTVDTEPNKTTDDNTDESLEAEPKS